jgi:hypothetical protein
MTVQWFINRNPIVTVSKMSKIEEITVQLAEEYSHILSDETKLILLLTQAEIFYPELATHISKCSKFFPEDVKKLIYKTSPDENPEHIIEKIVEHVLYTEHFWAKYYHDAIVIYNIKKFSEQLSNGSSN